jgi:hypothetical protein
LLRHIVPDFSIYAQIVNLTFYESVLFFNKDLVEVC